MGPSDSLPGREGTMVSPSPIVMVWSINEAGDINWHFIHGQLINHRSLCFRCIETCLPDTHHNNLKSVYDAYEAETNYHEIEKSHRGKLIGGEEMHQSAEAGSKMISLCEALDSTHCLYCNKEIENDREPYFISLGIDRVYSRRHLSGFPGESNYSWSNMKTGRTFTQICFSCFKEAFPKTFKQLSHDLLGTSNPDFVPNNEFLISPDVVKAMEEYYGFEEAHRMIENINKP